MKKRLILFLLITALFSPGYSQEKMEVEGAIIIKNSEDASPAEGTIRYNPDAKDFEGWNGVEWLSLTSRNMDGANGTVQDIEGNTYTTVKIGNQWWMAENLRTTTYNDGTVIPKVTDGTDWENLTTPGYCWYDNDSTTYAEDYGALYNYYAVADTNSLNICPVGWRVPGDTAWTNLTDYLDGSGIAGGKMKEAGTTHWNSPNTGATNECGFTGIPGGYRFTDGEFVQFGNYGYWWSSTESGANAWFRYLVYVNDDVVRSFVDKWSGFSVRCVMD